jgi:uncharacterized delta-60 repeat protein
MALMRFDEAGEPDRSFGVDGLVTSDPLMPPVPGEFEVGQARNAFVDLRIQPDGRIVAIGNLKRCGGRSCWPAGSVVRRFTADGSTDVTFAGGGEISLAREVIAEQFGPIWRGGELSALALRPKGGILVGGDVKRELAVLGYRADGSPDPSWGGNGVVTSSIETSEGFEGIGASAGKARAVLSQPGGRIVAVGDHSLLGLLPDGRIDRSFGRGGSVYTDGGAWSDIVWVRDGTIDSKGRILLAGAWRGHVRSAIVRMFPNGRFDPRFAGDGLAALDLSKANFRRGAEGATGIAINSDGSVLGAGFAYADGHGELALVSLRNGDGRLAHCRGRAAVLQGTPGSDRLSGKGPIAALGGNDRVVGSGGPICGGRGDDRVKAGAFGVNVYGGPGDDRLTGKGPGVVGHGGVVVGGPGDDVIRTAGGRENDVFKGGPGDDLLLGGAGLDRLFGGPGADRLYGGNGADRIWGGSGDDLLSGGYGFNRLRGGPGHDRIRSGPTGPPARVYRAKSRPALRLRLVVRRRQVTGVHIRALARCVEGGYQIHVWGTNQAAIKIDPSGRFQSHFEIEGLDGYSGDDLVGRVLGDRIVGKYRSRDTEEGFCATGKPGHRDLRFVARRVR